MFGGSKQKQQKETDNLGLCETVLVVGLSKSCGILRSQRWSGSTQVKVTVTPFSLFIEAEVFEEIVTLGQQTMKIGEEQNQNQNQNQENQNESDAKKTSEKEGKVSKMIDEEMQKLTSKITRTGVIMAARGLTGRVGAGVNISCGIVSVEIELCVALSSVVYSVAPGGVPGELSQNIQPKAAEVPIAKQLFDKFDKDKSGTISPKEFEELCYELGHKLTKEELSTAFKVLDKDGSKSIKYEEFKNWWESNDKFKRLMIGSNEQEAVQRAIKYFRKYDKDSSGTLDQREFKHVHKKLLSDKLTTKDFETTFAQLDSDKSGSISFNEYVEWLMNV